MFLSFRSYIILHYDLDNYFVISVPSSMPRISSILTMLLLIILQIWKNCKFISNCSAKSSVILTRSMHNQWILLYIQIMRNEIFIFCVMKKRLQLFFVKGTILNCNCHNCSSIQCCLKYFVLSEFVKYWFQDYLQNPTSTVPWYLKDQHEKDVSFKKYEVKSVELHFCWITLWK